MSNSLFLLILVLCLFVNPCLSDPRATEAALICTNKTSPMPQRQTFLSNFLAAMETVTPLIATQRYAAVVNGTGNTTVYAFGECMKDLTKPDCDLCFAQCKSQILRCLPYQRATRGGRLFYDGCYLRYDDYYFFNEALSAPDRTVCGAQDFVGNGSVFRANVNQLVMNLSVEAPKFDGFSVGSVNNGNVTVYGLAQCWEFVNGTACEDCLANAVSNISSCTPKQEGRVLNTGCYLRYSTEKFYYNSTQHVRLRNSNQESKLAIALAATSSALALLLVIATVVFIVRKNVLKRRGEREQLGPLLATVNNSKLNYSYEVLEKATNYFHHSKKLGQGGSGSVYKGVLPDGKVVAIKRLFFNTRQWVDHFFNEVNLISDIHHKNLVKLLGCSIAGPESLLVYEYVPNQSLHDYFSAKRKFQLLKWEVRYKIILGTAEGLAYLHEELEMRIIHRDIKLSNILLEEDFTAKIADFGLARLFPEDKTHISTGIAGTLGYMAPEYVIRGILTEKADVYSFGVLVIEVVSGKRNNTFSQYSYSILQMVWNLYGIGRVCEAVDPALEGQFQEEEASRLLQIGLLCVQASAELRPSMSTVVKMLSDNHEIPQPTHPPFLNSSSAEISQSRPSRIYNSQPESYTHSLGRPSRTYNSQPESYTHSSGNNSTESGIEPR
ncbi:cysteine-rich receptor-like protein kinase 3 isoform X5 [Quercus robur]|uniref:cysteine-rich receptor-like protein kinase 3 isoform X3 n=1 Tax=Quercus robur TaxID=38942 RepID=UPI00216374DD|nr:cysteine-rich receptor-like protein kinase 3 isoform X3 [Quercus robur]XP_050276583.1 cysteine-rich receptor-like protein kinase 3 isoform X4 [Quercus robur]XP_050276584.1 cysteine-rich receptor-like protein kinase 3 isoform X5 [Quercus robur]